MPDQNEERKTETKEMGMEELRQKIDEGTITDVENEMIGDLEKRQMTDSEEHLEKLKKKFPGFGRAAAGSKLSKEELQLKRLGQIAGGGKMIVGEKIYLFDDDQKEALENLVQDSQAAQLAFRESARLMKDTNKRLWDALRDIFPQLDPDRYHLTFNHDDHYIQCMAPNKKGGLS